MKSSPKRITSALLAAVTGILLATAPAQIPVLREEGFSVLAFGSDGAAVTAGLRQSLAAMRSA